jgi:hypothetical protein
MRIVADEGIERPLVLRLRASGHDVIHIAEIAPGSTDLEILELARGMSVNQILEKYPQLTPEGVKAALEFAAESVRFDHVTPQSAPLPEEQDEDSQKTKDMG